MYKIEKVKLRVKHVLSKASDTTLILSTEAVGLLATGFKCIAVTGIRTLILHLNALQLERLIGIPH